MRKIIRLTESDLTRIVRRVIKENEAPERYVIDVETGNMVGTHKYGVGFVVNKIGERMGYESHPTSIPDGTKMERNNDGDPYSYSEKEDYNDELMGDRDDFSSLRNIDEDENDDEDDDDGGYYTFDFGGPKDSTALISDIVELIDNSEDVNDFKMKIKQYTKDNQKDFNNLSDDKRDEIDRFINSVITRHDFN